MDTTSKIIVGVAIAVLLLVGAVFMFSKGGSTTEGAQSESGPLDAFAQCLGEKGAKFYGAFWCPHCQNQKAMFGSAQKHLPYVECSTTDGKGRLPVCEEVNIEGYPTWIFADNSRLSGEVELKVLAEKTGCELPTQQ